MKKQSIKRSDILNNQPQDSDVFQVVLTMSDRVSLAQLVRELGLDIDHQHPADERNIKEVNITAFLTQQQIDEVKSRGWCLRVEKNLSEIGRERQKEVGEGDRFEKGKVKPKGLGKKIREEN